MSFQFLKQYVPGSLYGRAALILVVPVVALQLVVSVVFIKRHLEDVTTQMTLTIVRELRMIGEQVGSVETPGEALMVIAPFAAPLQMDIRFSDPDKVPPTIDTRRWYDFSATVVSRTLRQAMPETLAVLMPDNQNVTLVMQSVLGPIEIEFNRRRVTAAAPHQLIVTMALFGLLMTIIAFLYLRNQLRPITRLARAAQAFGRGVNLPYSPGGATEVRAAGGAFLDMRARIERQIEQRTLMLSGVSHDLRTPLTRLRLELAMLPEDEAAPLLRDVEEMQRLVNAFLDFSKGVSESAPERVDPLQLVSGIVADAQRAGVPVTLGAMTGSGKVTLRPTAIRRAVENLLGNAVRYGTNARVTVTRTEKSLRIRVEDDGPGIPQDQWAEAIKPFARLDPSRNQNLGSGVGLGLAIVNDIARAHGGVLRLGKSEAMGGLQADIVIGI